MQCRSTVACWYGCTTRLSTYVVLVHVLYTITLAMRTNAPTRLQSPNDNSHPCARDLDLAWQVLGTVARGPLPIKKKRIGLSRAPGPYSKDNNVVLPEPLGLIR